MGFANKVGIIRRGAVYARPKSGEHAGTKERAANVNRIFTITPCFFCPNALYFLLALGPKEC